MKAGHAHIVPGPSGHPDGQSETLSVLCHRRRVSRPLKGDGASECTPVGHVLKYSSNFVLKLFFIESVYQDIIQSIRTHEKLRSVALISET